MRGRPGTCESMNITLWTFQSVLAFVFLYSGANKSIFSEQRLVASGQTGVEGLPLPLIRFIGISEVLGSLGLLLPWYLSTVPVLTAIAAACLGSIMVPAAMIHFRRGELRNVAINTVLLCACAFVAWGRGFSV